MFRTPARDDEKQPRGVEKKDSRDGLKAALVRPPVMAAVDLGASKVTCFIMKPEGVQAVAGRFLRPDPRPQNSRAKVSGATAVGGGVGGGKRD
jgi:hypothetical protein